MMQDITGRDRDRLPFLHGEQVLQPTKASIPFVARQKLKHALVALSDSAHTFHLAGSYYFGVATTDSDVDFYVAQTPEVLVFLAEHGYHRLGWKDGYEAAVEIPERDVAQHNNTFAVYEHATLPIHIQVFYDLPVALVARDILAKTFKLEHTRTRGPNRTKMWAAAHRAAVEILSLASPA